MAPLDLEPIPADAPTALTIRQAATVARLNPNTVRGWVDRGKVTAYQDGENTVRFIRTEEFVAACERRGILPDWEAFADFV